MHSTGYWLPSGSGCTAPAIGSGLDRPSVSTGLPGIEYPMDQDAHSTQLPRYLWRVLYRHGIKMQSAQSIGSGLDRPSVSIGLPGIE